MQVNRHEQFMWAALEEAYKAFEKDEYRLGCGCL
jgi:tRNA(Arg) A34 adenosine deaminase TadA